MAGLLPPGIAGPLPPRPTSGPFARRMSGTLPRQTSGPRLPRTSGALPRRTSGPLPGRRTSGPFPRWTSGSLPYRTSGGPLPGRTSAPLPDHVQGTIDRAQAVVGFLEAATELLEATRNMGPDGLRMQVPYFVDMLQLRRLQGSQVPGVVVVGVDAVLKALRELWAAGPQDRRRAKHQVISVACRCRAYSRGPQP
jgi:hypothetical protein